MKTEVLFYPTKAKLEILENLSRFEVLTARDLSLLIYGDESHPHITTINKTLDILDERHHLVNRIYFRPEEYTGRGNLPNASGLSADGVAFATERWPATYPKEFPRTHSPHTIEHDLRRARTHIKVHALAKENGWDLGWKKGDNRFIKPDDVFEITAAKTAHFFLEEEHKRKDFKQLYAKLKPYVDLHGTSKMKDEWGFRYYTVIVPMRDAEAMANLITHLRGSCDCVDRKLKQMHSGSPFKLVTNVLTFTTHEDMIERTAGPILHATTGKALSFLDIVR
jgi:hypothetical protein